MSRRLLLVGAIAVTVGACAAGGSDDAIERSPESVEAPAVDLGSFSDVQRNLMTPGPGRLPVTFRHDAPDADAVRMEFTGNFWNRDQDDTIELIRVDDDMSSHALTLHLGEDRWLYRYRVDWRWESDEFADTQVEAENAMFNSLVRVGSPVADSTPVEPADAGTVERITIDSDALGRPMPYVLYTPPGEHDDTLDVLVLLHGFGQPATEWTEAVGVEHFMDNLIADGRIEPFAIVMPSGETDNYTGRRARHVVDEVLPDARERLAIPAERTRGFAIGGFSQGGAGALRLSYEHPDLFGLTMPISMAGPCGTRCEESFYDTLYPDGFETTIAMWVGVDDEIGLADEHERFAAYADAKGLTVEDVRSTSDGHRLSGHSIRYVRAITTDVLRRADQFFATV